MSRALLCRQLALGLLSVSLIALQLALMQTFSISQWHHFAYMVISVALLGFGAAGTVLTLWRPWFLRRSAVLLPQLLFSCALAITFAAGRVQLLFGRFDSYLLPYDPTQAVLLLAVILLLTLPFFLGALVIGILFVEQADRIGLTYFANLFGSGLGGLVGLAVLSHFPPEQLAPALALPTLLAGLLLLPPKRLVLRLSAGVVFAAIALALIFAPELPLSQFKDLQKTLDLPDSRLVALRNDPYGQVRAVSSPALRFAPGLSLTYSGSIPAGDALFSNGDWFGFIPTAAYADAARLLDQTTQGLPFALNAAPKVLVLQAGTGLTAAQALNHQAASVAAIEPHRAALELLQNSYPQSAGTFFSHPQLKLVAAAPRTWLASDSQRYDLVVLPTLGAFGGTAGVFALHEQHNLTREAFAEIWRHLAPDGVFCLTAWVDYPPRVPLRLAATLVELLEAQGVATPSDHLAAVRSWGMITFCLKRSPLTREEIDRVRRFCATLGFDPLLLPGLTAEERERFHRLPDRTLFDLLDRVIAGDRQLLYQSYPFNLHPATDDRPLFSQFLRCKSLPRLAELLGQRTLPVMELGTLVVFATFLLMSATAIVLILLPLLRLGGCGGCRTAVFGYFGSLGLGYMLVEIALIHRFVLYLGHPVYAAATVICALLIGSGVGSACSDRLSSRWNLPQLSALAVAVLLLGYALLLTPLLQQTILLSTTWRLPLTLALLIPAGMLMGLPFPLGLRWLNRRHPEAVPWGWGINGCLSVLGTTLATLIAVLAGFRSVLIIATLIYATASLSAYRLFPESSPKNRQN